MTVKYVRTRRIDLADLTMFPGNPKRGDVASIRTSLKRHGQYRALVVRQTDAGELIVLAGNNTLEALRLEEFRDARCEVISCEDDEARRINLADNRLAELGEYDQEQLVARLQDLAGDLDGIGYTQTDLDTLIRVTESYGTKATGFLDGEVDPDNPAGRTHHEDDQPAGQAGFVQVSWSLSIEHRDMVRAALKAVQAEHDLQTSTEALVHLCQGYLEERGDSERTAA